MNIIETTPSSGGGSSLPTGAIAGIAAGVVVALVVAVV